MTSVFVGYLVTFAAFCMIFVFTFACPYACLPEPALFFFSPTVAFLFVVRCSILTRLRRSLRTRWSGVERTAYCCTSKAWVCSWSGRTAIGRGMKAYQAATPTIRSDYNSVVLYQKHSGTCLGDWLFLRPSHRQSVSLTTATSNTKVPASTTVDVLTHSGNIRVFSFVVFWRIWSN